MSDILRLARPEILALEAYVAANYDAAAVRLNANESPQRLASDNSQRGLNWYPEERPLELQRVLASHFELSEEQLLITRGSSEAIDLIIRAFCTPAKDGIVVCPPNFSMYDVYANIQGANVKQVPLLAETFEPDVKAILSSWQDTDKILFLTTPNNPTANCLDPARVSALADGLRDRALVVIDAAYIEFSNQGPFIHSLLERDNVVVLRTLSKAYAMAGARLGCMLASPSVVALIDKILPPYALSTPVVDAALDAMSAENLNKLVLMRKNLVAERVKLENFLGSCPAVERVYRSDANFLLVRFQDPSAALVAAKAQGLLLRDFQSLPQTHNCLRISIGSPDANERLMNCLGNLKEPAA
ncbi:MAG: histidinol-phosphate transaminase [Pseudomonadota bacterium]